MRSAAGNGFGRPDRRARKVAGCGLAAAICSHVRAARVTIAAGQSSCNLSPEQKVPSGSRGERHEHRLRFCRRGYRESKLPRDTRGRRQSASMGVVTGFGEGPRHSRNSARDSGGRTLPRSASLALCAQPGIDPSVRPSIYPSIIHRHAGPRPRLATQSKRNATRYDE